MGVGATEARRRDRAGGPAARAEPRRPAPAVSPRERTARLVTGAIVRMRSEIGYVSNDGPPTLCGRPGVEPCAMRARVMRAPAS